MTLTPTSDPQTTIGSDQQDPEAAGSRLRVVNPSPEVDDLEAERAA